ncbi:putative ribonuclease H-like domain-containing protein, partial [Tanacetum coccineum]
MDVKSVFLYGKIEDEVYVYQPLGFEDPEFPNRVDKRGQIDKTLFIKRVKSDILLVQVYVDDIIFRSTKKELCTEFEKLMHKKFQMSSIGELTFFLGLQVTQKDDGIFISQDKYVDEILKKFGFSTMKIASTPIETLKPLIKDENAKDVDVHLYRLMIGSLMYLISLRPDIMFVDSHIDLEAYTDSDYAGESLDRKSTTGGCQFLGSRLISWQCKKQTIVANSTTKAKYVAAASCSTNDEIQVSVVGLTYYYVLTVNPTIYTSCFKQLWATAKVKTVNGEVQIQDLVDGKKVIVTETSVRRALQLKDAGVFLDKQVEGMTKHKKIYVTPSYTKKVFANMKKEGKYFSGRVTPLFEAMMSQKKQPRRKQRKDTKVPQPSGSTEPITDEAANEEHVHVHSNDPLLSGEDRLKLNELMELCTNLSQRVLDLENTKTSQAAEITKLKERVKKLERRNKSRTLGLKRLRKVGRTARIESSEDEGLGAQEDASKQGRKIDDLDADAEVTLVDEAQGRIDDNLMFDTGVFDEEEVEVEKVVSTAEVTTASATTTTVDELTLAQTLIEIKAAKPKAVTTAATTTTTAVTRPKARGVVVQEPSEFRTTTSSSQLPQAKDKGKAKMIEPEKPLKKKDQILVDEEIAQRLQEELQAELEEEERLAR